jgi:hypothetical protein
VTIQKGSSYVIIDLLSVSCREAGNDDEATQFSELASPTVNTHWDLITQIPSRLPTTSQPYFVSLPGATKQLHSIGVPFAELGLSLPMLIRQLPRNPVFQPRKM